MNHPHDDRPPSPLSVPIPVVLCIMPKVGSSAPIGYIYDPDPSHDGGEGGLLAASVALLLRGTHSVCLLWWSTFLLHRRLQSPELILSPSLPLFMGGLGGALAPSDRQLSRLSTSLCKVCVLRGGILNSIPSLKNTPHHALAVSSHRLNMGGALPPVAVSLRTITVNGPPISSTGKLRIWVLTHTPNWNDNMMVHLLRFDVRKHFRA